MIVDYQVYLPEKCVQISCILWQGPNSCRKIAEVFPKPHAKRALCLELLTWNKPSKEKKKSGNSLLQFLFAEETYRKSLTPKLKASVSKIGVFDCSFANIKYVVNPGAEKISIMTNTLATPKCLESPAYFGVDKVFVIMEIFSAPGLTTYLIFAKLQSKTPIFETVAFSFGVSDFR